MSKHLCVTTECHSSHPAVPDDGEIASTVAVIRPGDRVLLAAAAGVTRADANHVKEQLSARHPGVEFTIVSGVTILAVQPRDGAEETPWPR